jgi:hypothetical protein
MKKPWRASEGFEEAGDLKGKGTVPRGAVPRAQQIILRTAHHYAVISQ